ncbi:MAG: tRNA 5-hydroxyuridine modification protein YegQ [Magnetococcales bacterium]|nr:tRNA 5-hydroxyuridine modification protein YegQ [Magnetococcales bacterium]
MKIPELLAPAGTLQSLRYALAYGADAVYVGLPRYSLRVRENEFDNTILKQAIQETRQHGKKLYLACNIAAHNSKIDSFLNDMAPIIDLGPDALILSDPGIIHLVRRDYPDVPIHLSVQANVVNYAAVRFWQQHGIQRIILSRELSLDEIETIRNRCPDIELETFIHGALCVAYSGRCLLSGYMSHRDANQGACTNACRWNYQAKEAEQTPEGDIIPKTSHEPLFLLEEKGRPGEWLAAEEDEHGTYIFNAKDLRAIQHVERFAQMGIHSLKIEGRTKSYFYVSRATQIYRQALDAVAAGAPFDPQWMTDLEDLGNRGYTEGFYRRHAPEQIQNYRFGHSQNHQRFVGEVINQEKGKMHVAVKNHFEQGDEMMLMTPRGNIHFTVEDMTNLKGEAMAVAPGSGHTVVMDAPTQKTLDYALLVKTHTSKGQNPA